MKDNVYLKVGIELCRHCGGRGTVAVEPGGGGVASVDSVVEGVCPLCCGSGRVKVRREIRVIVEAYDITPAKPIVE